MAVTVKVAELSALAIWLWGWTVMTGGCGPWMKVTESTHPASKPTLTLESLEYCHFTVCVPEGIEQV